MSTVAIKNAARTWFIVAITGQTIFGVYIAAFYGGAAMRGHFELWNRGGSRHVWIPGDYTGNATFAIHMLSALVLTLGGIVQLIPQIRERAPAFHRWTGRLYMLTAFTASLAGLYLMWVRGTIGDLSQHVAISINAILIMLFAILAWRTAVKRQLGIHRRWALRLFLAANGVWFFRIGLMFWILVNRAKTFEGPAITFLAFAQYLLPLGVLELYLRARDRGGRPARIAVATAIGALTLVTAAGVVGASLAMWIPHIR
ncbi:MAG TPA: DUF2306 domain-containing protein [Thermoanaerobaculia bacterium]